MKVLWITSIMLPPICEAMKMSASATGGWIYSSLKQLRQRSDMEFVVASIYPGNEFIHKTVDGINWYLLPLKGKSNIHYYPQFEEYWRKIKQEQEPDVIHIHGSEFPHGLAYIRACGSCGVIVSLQGIISCIARYYAAGIDHASVKKRLTLRDFLLRSGIYREQKVFEQRGRYEIEMLINASHIIGRTEWDKVHAWAINPTAQYHFCGETLRDVFYHHKWDYTRCEPHSIFVSQAGYPIKGLHMLLKAMPLILSKYPEAKIYVAGGDPTARPWYLMTGYGKYLQKLIKSNKLNDKVIFTGTLDETAMCERYLRSNVFVCCSAIENSPNSLGEAQLLGMPYVASFVGGVPEIVNWNPDVLYRFEEHEMLAEKICKIFYKAGSFTPIYADLQRYNASLNSDLLIDIYRSII